MKMNKRKVTLIVALIFILGYLFSVIIEPVLTIQCTLIFINGFVFIIGLWTIINRVFDLLEDKRG